MTELVWKLRVAMLWIFLGVAAATGWALLLYEPGTVRDIMRGEIEGVDLGSAEIQIQLATQALVPLAMAFTTLAVNDRRTNRRANGVLGLLYAASALISLVGRFSDPLAFMGAVMFLVSLLQLWHVWKWPMPGRAGSLTHKDPAVRR